MRSRQSSINISNRKQASTHNRINFNKYLSFDTRINLATKTEKSEKYAL